MSDTDEIAALRARVAWLESERDRWLDEIGKAAGQVEGEEVLAAVKRLRARADAERRLRQAEREHAAAGHSESTSRRSDERYRKACAEMADASEALRAAGGRP